MASAATSGEAAPAARPWLALVRRNETSGVPASSACESLTVSPLDRPGTRGLPSLLDTFRTRLNRLRIRYVLESAGRLPIPMTLVIVRNRPLTEGSCRTMGIKTGTKGWAVPACYAGAETCGGVMFRGPYSGNGTRSSVHYPDSGRSSRAGHARAGLGPARSDSEGFGPPRLGTAMAEDETSRPTADPRARGAWGGAGGRWLLWPLRVVLWSALLIVAYRGVTGIVFSDAAASSGGGLPAANPASVQFPVTLAEAYATEFGQAYLNFSPQTQAQRERELAAFVPASMADANPDLGWNGSGELSLESEQVANISVQDPHHAVVTLLATVNGQLMELGVPIIASGGGMAVSGEPAWLPAPQQITVRPAAVRSDRAAQNALMNELPAFFQAYAGGDSAALNRFLAPGASLTGLDGTVAFDSIASVDVPAGGMTRQISVTVIWRLAGQDESGITKLAMTYGMSVVELQSGKWYVKEVSASTEAVGAQ
jgi:Conjugative transposon protein TcpC